MVLLEHLPLFGLAFSLAHQNHGRASHDNPALMNHRVVPQISDGVSRFPHAPKMLAARASDESHETTIQVPQHHLQSILDRIKSLEQEISNMMSSRADSSLDFGSTPAKYASQDPNDIEFTKAALAAIKPERLVVTTRQEPKSTPASAAIGGLFKEASNNVDASAVLDGKFTTTITSTTQVTRTVTIVPTRILTLTEFQTNRAKESKFKALVPVSKAESAPSPPRTILRDDRIAQQFSSSSADVETESRRPQITPHGFNASATFHPAALSAAPSGFRTIRRVV
ncbi:hypothetical protein TARUN_8342 [Trichoderma arundinaceum]|uniref:Uncharacterized protein n=1 Tax=Trichoderma arundinaceum TaxID=490622 RepID=A0A395ND73_TRIAR|nr:hypothetical protein TARUN_8342 [Trichoderma arundinaceum]